MWFSRTKFKRTRRSNVKRDRLLESAFIPAGGDRIFSCYSTPQGDLVRTSAVLLLYPIEQEYKRVHWAYRSLASALAKNGFPVLRFDYLGTGDSSGETGSGDLDLWTQNALAAANYLRDRSSALHLQVVGIRLGAVIATQLASLTPILNNILWDPIQTGNTLLSELKVMESSHRHYDEFKKVHVPKMSEKDQDFLVGFPMSRKMSRQLEEYDLSNQALASTFSHIVLTKGEDPPHFPARRNCHVHGSDEHIGWGNFHRNQEALMAPKTLKLISYLIESPFYE